MTEKMQMTQDGLKTLVGQAALQYVVRGEIVGVGTGSTVNKFIDALADIKHEIPGAVSSSEASTLRLRAMGIRVFDANDVGELSVYIDGADEIDGHGNMVKGGGAALTREKIVAAQSRRFICIVDESKRVDRLGRFPIPVEVIPMAGERLMRQFAALSADGRGPSATGIEVTARVRLADVTRGKMGQSGENLPLVTDNGQQIIDIMGLQLADPLAFESMVNQWPGVVSVGVFAHQRAQVCLLGTTSGVKTLEFAPRDS